MTFKSIPHTLRAVNPVRVEDLGDSSHTAQAERLLRDILATPVRRRTRGLVTRGRLVGAGIAAALAVGVPFAVQTGGGPASGPAYAATPVMLGYQPTGMPGAAVLRDLASRIEASQSGTATGTYCYSKIQRWLLGTSVDPQARTMTAVVTPELIQTWVAPDGTGRIERTPGPVERQGPEQPMPPGNTVIELTPVQPSAVVADPPVDLGGLSTDPAVLGGQLEALPVRRKGVGDSAPGWLRRQVQIRAIWAEQPVAPALQAAFLRVLADTPGLTDLGAVTDRAGRQGRAVGADLSESGATVRHVIILDGSTGQPLGYEEVLRTPGEAPAAVPVRYPAVVQYVAYLATARVPTVHTIP